MAALASSNVVNLNEFDRMRRATPPAESGRLLSDCRDFAMRRLSQSLHEMLAQVEEELFQAAEASYDRELQNLYLEARGKARANWSKVEAAFSRAFVDHFNKKIRGEMDNAVQVMSLSATELSLVEDDDLTKRITVKEIAGHLKESCDEELYALGQRVGVLLGKEELSDEENPISPESVCEALEAACEELEGNVRLKLLLLRQLERHVSAALINVYRELNQQFVAWNILPDLRRGYRRPVNKTVSPRVPGQPAAGSGDKGTVSQPQDLLSTLQQLVQTQYLAGAASGGSAASLGVVPGAALPASENQLGAFLDSLTQLQRGELPPAPEGAAPAFAAPLPVDGSVNVVRQLKTQGMVQGAPLDNITIDIVAMLFDFIFDDSKIPDPIKALVGRLQIPVLKVALLDHTFFSSKAHPARRLLDGISAATVRWSREVDQEDPLYLKIADIVGRIQEDFENDTQIFVDLLDELERFVDEQEAEEQSLVCRSAEMLEQREHEEIAWVVAGEQVQRRLGPGVPDAVREFLLNQWQHVLKVLYVCHGEEHESWRGALATMDDLIWSVAPKNGVEERRRLVALLPDLLGRLHEGLDVIALSHAQRAPFLDVLVDLHSAAVKAGLQAALGTENAPTPSVWQEKALAAAPAEAAPEQEESKGELLVTRVTENDIQIEEVMLVGARREDGGNGDIYVDRVNGLRRGDWVEFRQEDGSAVRRRLSWVSPKRGIFLFTSHGAAGTALSISPDALAHQFRYGFADIVHEEPLFDRAVNGMLDALQVGV
ncbi:MAG: DUF1631 domain-containing protein [Pseudomonadota bacterium]